jgi:hypothetical protein
LTTAHQPPTLVYEKEKRRERPKAFFGFLFLESKLVSAGTSMLPPVQTNSSLNTRSHHQHQSPTHSLIVIAYLAYYCFRIVLKSYRIVQCNHDNDICHPHLSIICSSKSSNSFIYSRVAIDDDDDDYDDYYYDNVVPSLPSCSLLISCCNYHRRGNATSAIYFT